jgi:glutamate/tyrosine decarboxylase-like PLP-dependent enzyme
MPEPIFASESPRSDSSDHPVLSLTPEARSRLWHTLIDAIESYTQNIEDLPVSPVLDADAIRRVAASWTFEKPLDPSRAIRDLVPQLTRYQVHTPHPSYFGLFNPNPTTMSIAADALVAALNPQLAAWSHNPIASEIELHLVRSLSEKFGIPRDQADGVFTSGGWEANQTALLAALTHRWPQFHTSGLRSLDDDPVFYVSAEGHHSFAKAARASGLGIHALREIPVTDRLQMDPAALRSAIEHDRAAGRAPFLAVATAGTTGAGAIDPLPEIAGIAREHALWFHVDAAWGGAAALIPEMRSLLDGIEHADSITFDAHKWLSVSMGAGMFLTRHSDILTRAFSTATAYMPKEGDRMQAVDPYSHSLQWSRRFIGLKLFLSLAVAGWDGYAATIRHQTAMGDLLRTRLREEGWTIVNATPLPLVCFTMDGWTLADCQQIANAVIESGQAWISTIQVGPHKQPALRACITNYATEPRHIEALLAVLEKTRAQHRQPAAALP